jgi:hypothetical protein
LKGGLLQHCNEWLNKNERSGINETSSPDHDVKASVFEPEEFKQVLPQMDVFVEIEGIPNLTANLPRKYLYKDGRGIAANTEARYSNFVGNHFVRYSNLYFKYWGAYDLLFTSQRLVLICAAPKDEPNPFVYLLPFGIVASQAREAYQLWRKQKAITNLDFLNTLVDEGQALYTTKQWSSEVIIAKETHYMSWWEPGETSRVVVKGNFVYKSKPLRGFLGFSIGSSKKDSRAAIEQTGIGAIRVLEKSVHQDSDLRYAQKLLMDSMKAYPIESQ